MEIVDNSFLRQFETKVSGGLAIIEYSVQERKIFLTKIFVPEMKSKDEFSELFISEVLEIIRDRNISVVPTRDKLFREAAWQKTETVVMKSCH